MPNFAIAFECNLREAWLSETVNYHWVINTVPPVVDLRKAASAGERAKFPLGVYQYYPFSLYLWE